MGSGNTKFTRPRSRTRLIPREPEDEKVSVDFLCILCSYGIKGICQVELDADFVYKVNFTLQSRCLLAQYNFTAFTNDKRLMIISNMIERIMNYSNN